MSTVLWSLPFLCQVVKKAMRDVPNHLSSCAIQLEELQALSHLHIKDNGRVQIIPHHHLEAFLAFSYSSFLKIRQLLWWCDMHLGSESALKRIYWFSPLQGQPKRASRLAYTPTLFTDGINKFRSREIYYMSNFNDTRGIHVKWREKS